MDSIEIKVGEQQQHTIVFTLDGNSKDSREKNVLAYKIRSKDYICLIKFNGKIFN